MLLECSDENSERYKINNFFFKEMNTQLSKVDEIQIFVTEEQDREPVLYILEVSYKKADLNFDLITSLLSSASVEGVTALSPPDREIVFLLHGKEIYRVAFCEADGRIEKRINNEAPKAILYLPAKSFFDM